MGRDASGVRGIRLRADDRAISLDVVRDDADLFVVTDTGFGKRVKIERFNRQGRGGQGVRAIRLTAARGFVVAAFMAGLDDELLLASQRRRPDPHRGARGLVARAATRPACA